MFSRHLFVPDKRKYIREKEKRDKSPCILCAIRDNLDEVKKYDVYRSENFIVSVNLYPYNPGHIMIFPKNHIESFDEFEQKNYFEFFELKKKCLKILETVYSPGGFNIGFNVGNAGGASIKHLHMHIVPRFENELGFVDILSGAKITIETPDEIYNKLKLEFSK
ncbi:MAG: HIT family protein [Candidatus Muiribacteriota bacterium]